MAGVAGPLRVSANGRYFVDQQGAPFFWLGDTAWPLFTQYSPEEALAYLENRAAKGFTVIQAVLAWGNGSGFETPLPGPNPTGHRPWKDSPAEPDPEYFSHIDRLLDAAERLGLVLAMLPTWGYYVVEAKVFTPENARIYGRFLGERYRDRRNVLWVSGGDRIPTGFEEVYRALARGLREGDAGNSLITYHPCGWRSSATFFHAEDWLDFNMIQTWTAWPHVYDSISADAFRTPVKPVVLAEGAYENGPEYPLGPITPLICRRQAWWAFMAGGSFTYGQNQMWRMEPGWVETFDTPGAQQMGLYRKIATSRAWQNRVADQGLFASGGSSERTLNAAVRGDDSSWALLYLADPCHVYVNLEKIEAKNARCTWVNPATGEERDAGTYPTSNHVGAVFPQGAQRWFTTPATWEDALLLLDGVE